MKKFFICLCTIGFLFYFSSPLLAGGIDNKHNFSAEYVRTLNRNAATDSADAVVYNPAGVMEMENGSYINLSTQYILKDYSSIDSLGLDQDEPSIVPALFGLYKQDKWSLFGAFTIPGGGGEVKFDKGSATTETTGRRFIDLTPHTSIGTQRINAESFYYGFTLGGAYKVDDTYSISLGARYIDAYSASDGQIILTGGAANSTWTTDYEKAADGWGGIIGLNINPEGPVNFGIRYETKTKLDFKYTVKTDTYSGPYGLPPLLAAQGIRTGATERRDLPGLLGLGAGFKITPKLRLDTTLTYYFQESADWNRAEDNVDNGFDAGFSLEYLFSDKLKGSAGYMYTDTGIDAKDMTKENPQLSANTLGTGVAYKYTPNLDLNFSIGKVFYKSDAYIHTPPAPATTPTYVDFDKDIVFLSFGIQYKFK